ncbi:RxLR effector protein PSR2 [Phytophthora ramorum]|uniref:RxLR effector protein PSR2 n=1 Tax=Phytophthora ramorum TaxID=164328 RepID=UPI0030A5E8BA|nr:RxLR effector protein PSR2 [Phytophthora ramorum]
MRLTCVILLAVAVLLENSDAASTPTEANMATPDTQAPTRSLIDGWQDNPTKRRLWIHKAANNKHDEERGVSIPKADKLDDLLQKGTSTDGVFKLLALDNAADDILGSPQLNAWISYMKRFNSKNPTNKASLIATLTAHYGDEALAKMIEAAKKVPTTAGFAKRVQTELVQRWLVAGETPDKVFALLKLDEAGAGLFAQPQVVTWAKYMDDFNMANPESKTTLFSALKKRYKDEEATLVQMLIAAEKVPSTKGIATRVQAEQTKLWLTERKEPLDVFKLLGLDEVGLTLLNSPLFSAWVKYTDDFRKIHYGTKLTTIATLRKYYRDDVLANMIVAAGKSSSTLDMSTRLETEFVREWYIRKFAPEHVFKLLRLAQTGDKLLTSPLFNTWARFMVYFSDLNPKKDVTLLTELANVYDKRELSKLLVAAWNVPRTKRLASDLQSARLRRWLSAKEDPVEVFYWLGAEGAAADDLSMLLYKSYSAAFYRLSRAPARNKL